MNQHVEELDRIRIGLVGAGRIGTSHAELLARRPERLLRSPPGTDATL
jgi:phosphoglycerate dehydrogenase-like enzyme